MADSIFNQVGRLLSTVVSNLQSQTQTKIDTVQSQIDVLNPLTDGLATEISDRQVADGVLQSNIDAEESARISADVSLQSSIDTKLNINANAVSATKLITPRNITLNGDIDGTALFDGNSDVTITTTLSATGSHTHTIDKIIGLQAELDSKLTTETNTSLSILGNILTYTDETGTQTNIDLSTYLDDTNLSRLVGGVYDSDTKEFVFSRDDASTFRVDASMFFDGSSLVTSVAGRTGAVVLTKGDVGLGNVDNTSDLAKPVSTATQTALDGKQNADPNIVSDASYVHTDNNYTTTDRIKLENIELNATADQSDAEIKIAYENNANTNAFTDSEKTKLASVDMSTKQDISDKGASNGYAPLDANAKVPVSNLPSTGLTGTPYTITTDDINPVNGYMQIKNIIGNTVFTETFNDGDHVILRIVGATNYEVTWPTIKWVGTNPNEPQLKNGSIVELWKDGGILYGCFKGSYSWLGNIEVIHQQSEVIPDSNPYTMNLTVTPQIGDIVIAIHQASNNSGSTSSNPSGFNLITLGEAVDSYATWCRVTYKNITTSNDNTINFPSSSDLYGKRATAIIIRGGILLDVNNRSSTNSLQNTGIAVLPNHTTLVDGVCLLCIGSGMIKSTKGNISNFNNGPSAQFTSLDYGVYFTGDAGIYTPRFTPPTTGDNDAFSSTAIVVEILPLI